MTTGIMARIAWQEQLETALDLLAHGLYAGALSHTRQALERGESYVGADDTANAVARNNSTEVR